MSVKDHEHFSPSSLLPRGSMGADWVTETFQTYFAKVFEQEAFAEA